MPETSGVSAERFHTLNDCLRIISDRGLPMSKPTLIRCLRERGLGRRFGKRIVATQHDLEQLLVGEPLTKTNSARAAA